MPEAVVKGLIAICLLALSYFLILWVLGAIGIHLPATVLNIIMVILALIVILMIIRMLRPYWGQWFP